MSEPLVPTPDVIIEKATGLAARITIMKQAQTGLHPSTYGKEAVNRFSMEYVELLSLTTKLISTYQQCAKSAPNLDRVKAAIFTVDTAINQLKAMVA